MAKIKLGDRIYGTDPGKFNSDEQIRIMSMSAWELFLMILHYESIFHTNLREKSVIDDYCQIDYLKNQTNRFGTTLPTPSAGKRLEESDLYQAWYRFYRNHYETLQPHIRNIAPKYINQGSEVSQWEPDGDWQPGLANTKK